MWTKTDNFVSDDVLRLNTYQMLRKASMKTQTSSCFRKKLNKLRNALETVCDTRQKQLSNLEISGEKVLGQIQTMRHDVNKAFDDLEAHTVAELDKMKSSQEKQVQTDVGIIRDTMGHVQKMLDGINEGKHKGEPSAFISFKKCQEILTQGQSTLQTMEMTTEVKVAFQPYTGILEFLSTLTKLGELSCIGGSASSLPGPDHTFVKENETQYNACERDEDRCDIAGICVLPKGQTLLADSSNKYLKLLNDTFTVISSHNLRKSLVSMCYVSSSEVAVALTDDNLKCTIQYIRVKDGGFEHTEARQLDHYCVSMACHGGNLFVLSRDTLYLYPTRKSESRVLHKLNNSDIYIKGCAVSPDGTRIFISRSGNNTLTTLNSDGTVLHTFTDPEMQAPSAIHVSPAGHVFKGCNDGAVLQVSSDGTRKLTTIAGSERTRRCIRSLCYNTNTGDLVVGCAYAKNITVIKLK